MVINIGISEDNRRAVADRLNQLLADEHILYNRTRSFHWNVEGASFMEFHKLYEDQYSALAEKIDEVAERIRIIGHFAEGRLVELVKLSKLEEIETPTETKAQVHILLRYHESIISDLRQMERDFSELYNDSGSSDFVNGLMQFHEKTAWVLRSYTR
jgi:starvation-inducible DNA-binding protein